LIAQDLSGFGFTESPDLAMWGRNDPFFLPHTEAFTRDEPKAQVRFHDTGHLTLETNLKEIGRRSTSFSITTCRNVEPVY
jgi:pimeloyl-ACP methyl ester carboxylesterase